MTIYSMNKAELSIEIDSLEHQKSALKKLYLQNKFKTAIAKKRIAIKIENLKMRIFEAKTRIKNL